MSQIIFTCLSVMTLVCAMGVIASKNTVNGAMCLLLSLVGVAGLVTELHAYLLAFFFLMIYGGAVAILFLFIIMLLDMQGGRPWSYRWTSVLSAVVAAGLLVSGLNLLAVRGQLATPPLSPHVVGVSLRPYAYQLFTTYLLPVEVIGFLLLIAMIGVIILSKKYEEDAQ